MQTANVLLSLGGDHGNTVSKYACTAAEVAVLLAIHGNDSINEIEPVGEIKRSHREERIRLLNIYGAAKTEDHKPIVEGMFPGVAARVFETLDELALDESFYKATGRVKAKQVAPPDPVWDAGLRNDGPTVAEWTAAGYSASAYPPRNYASKSTPEEIAAAVAASTHDDPEADETDEPVGEDIDDEHADKDILG